MLCFQHYNLDKENLQYLSMQVSTISTSLFRQLSRDPEAKLGTQILSDVARALSKVKVLISWLDRHPFKDMRINHSDQNLNWNDDGFKTVKKEQENAARYAQYSEIRVQLLRLGLELATIAQRDRFVQNPIMQITILAQKLSMLSDYIIQDISDSMCLQPAYLDLVTLKKRESELGFVIAPSYQFIHR